MKIRFLISPNRKDISTADQSGLLENALSEFFGKYSMSPDSTVPIIARVGALNQIELHPLANRRVDLGLWNTEQKVQITPGGNGRPLDYATLETDHYRFQVYFIGGYLPEKIRLEE